MASFVLVHSPVVGPSTWRWVADTLAARGHRVTVPAVTGSIIPRGWEAFADVVAGQIDRTEHVVLVGHSGAGPLLPQIAACAPSWPAGLVFVDAGVPPESGVAGLIPDEILVELSAMAYEGVLPKWSDWFGAKVMQQLVPDEEKRTAVCADLPSVPVSYFQAQVPVPLRWGEMSRCGYVLLSETYVDEAAKATRRGWPVERVLGAHLDIVTHPTRVTSAILSVAAQLEHAN